ARHARGRGGRLSAETASTSPPPTAEPPLRPPTGETGHVERLRPRDEEISGERVQPAATRLHAVGRLRNRSGDATRTARRLNTAECLGGRPVPGARRSGRHGGAPGDRTLETRGADARIAGRDDTVAGARPPEGGQRALRRECDPAPRLVGQ